MRIKWSFDYEKLQQNIIKLEKPNKYIQFICYLSIVEIGVGRHMYVIDFDFCLFSVDYLCDIYQKKIVLVIFMLNIFIKKILFQKS